MVNNECECRSAQQSGGPRTACQSHATFVTLFTLFIFAIFFIALLIIGISFLVFLLAGVRFGILVARVRSWCRLGRRRGRDRLSALFAVPTLFNISALRRRLRSWRWRGDLWRCNLHGGHRRNRWLSTFHAATLLGISALVRSLRSGCGRRDRHG